LHELDYKLIGQEREKLGGRYSGMSLGSYLRQTIEFSRLNLSILFP